MRKSSLLLASLLSLALTGIPGPSVGAPPDASFESIVRKVEEIRGLRFKRPVAREVMTSEQMRQEVRRQMELEYKPSDWAPLEATLKAFRLIPASSDLKRLLMTLLEQQAAGLYDPRSKRLFVLTGGMPSGGDGMEEILGDAGLDLGDTTLAHELAHALDDQHFDLLSLPVEERYDQDRAGAAMAVVEGDATWVMMQFMFGSLGFDPEAAEGLDGLGEMLRGSGLSMGEGVPRYVQENLLGAYLDGLVLVKRVRARGGSAAVDALFRKPPQSVEQVLHPEKYFASEAPERFTVRPPPAWTAAGYKEYTSGVWGELNAKIILQELNVSDDRAVRASEGWAGDAYSTARDPKGNLGWVWVTRWDTETDAKEFRDAIASSPSLKVTLDGRQVTVFFGGPPSKK